MPQSIARRPDFPRPRLTVAALLVIAATVLALARGLPTHTFYAGDPGVKLIATRHVVAHPTQPLEIPLPQIAGEPTPFVDPFFIVHGEHCARGCARAVPAAERAVPCAVRPGRACTFCRPSACCSPWRPPSGWRYSWTRAAIRSPTSYRISGNAADLLWAGILGACPGSRGRRARGGRVRTELGREHRRGVFGAGCLFGVAALLRPEALWFAVAVLACCAASAIEAEPGHHRHGGCGARRRDAPVGAVHARFTSGTRFHPTSPAIRDFCRTTGRQSAGRTS